MSSAVLVFVFKSLGKNTGNNKIVNNIIAPSGNKVAEDETTTNFLEELKNNHPEFSVAQLEFYSDTVTKGEMAPCRGREDEADCIAAVAFISRAYYICGEINDEKTRIECADAILAKKAATEIDKCYSLNTANLKTQCLVSIFQIYAKPENCSGFKAAAVRQICEGVVYYQMALLQQNKKLCDNIKDEYFKNYCSKNIVD